MKTQAHAGFTSGKYQILCKTQVSCGSGLDSIQLGYSAGISEEDGVNRGDLSSARVAVLPDSEDHSRACSQQAVKAAASGERCEGWEANNFPAMQNFDAPSSQERSGSDDGAPAQGQVAGDAGLSLSDWGIRSTIQHPRGASIHFVKNFSSSVGLKSRTNPNILRFFRTFGVSWRLSFLGRLTTYWAELMRRTLAPLRKIVARELEVFELRRNSVHPQSFAVHDRLECGHVHTSLLWDIFDLLNAYTESPHVRAIRHRCSECLTLVQRKPVQSVTAVAKAA